MNKQQEIKEDIRRLLEDWKILSLKDKLYRIKSIEWKLKLSKVSKKKMSEKNKKNRGMALSKTAKYNLVKGIK